MLFLLYQPIIVGSTCCSKGAQKISKIYNLYCRNKGKYIYIYIYIYMYVCMCVFEYQSLRKIQLFKKFWAIIFQSCFNWKNMITLNNDCIHRRQLAWFVWGKLSTWPSNRLVLLYLHRSSRR